MGLPRLIRAPFRRTVRMRNGGAQPLTDDEYRGHDFSAKDR